MSRRTSRGFGFVVAAIAACSHSIPAPNCPTAPIAPAGGFASVPAPSVPAVEAVATAQPPAKPERVAASGYDKPPQHVLDVLHAPSPPQPYVSPTRDRILLVSWVDYPSIAQVAEPYLRLAGVRVEPRTRRKHDTAGGYGVAPCAASITLVDVATSRERPLALPAGGCVDNLQWAADGTRFAFRNTSHDAVELWVAEVAS